MSDQLVVSRDVAFADIQPFNRGLDLVRNEFLKDERVLLAGTIDLPDGLSDPSATSQDRPTTLTVLQSSKVSEIASINGITPYDLDLILRYEPSNQPTEASFSGLQFYNFVPGRTNVVNNQIKHSLTNLDVPFYQWRQVQKMSVEFSLESAQSLPGLTPPGGASEVSLNPMPLDILWFLPNTPEKAFRPLGRKALTHLTDNGITLHLSEAKLQ